MIKRIALFAALALTFSGTAAVRSSAQASAAGQEIQTAYGNHSCLDAEDDSGGNPSQDGDRVQMWQCNGGNNQEWSFVSVLNGQDWQIVNEASGKCLDAEADQYGDPDSNGDRIQLWTCNGGHNQYWSEALSCSDGLYSAVYFNQYAIDHGFSKVLDANNSGLDPDVNGDFTQVWTPNYNKNQCFTGGI